MAFSLLQLLGDIPLAFVDTETTGASAAFGHRVIEIGIVRVERGRVVAEYQQLVDPGRRISPGVTALTGISQEMVCGQPSFEQQLPAALPLLRGAMIIGHNVRFDLSFLRREFRRARLDLCLSLEDAPVMDTVRIARRRFGRGGNALQSLAPRLGVTPAVAHRALADAQTTWGVFEKLMHPVGGWNLCLCDAWAQQGGPMGLLPIRESESSLPLELEEALESRSAVMMDYLDARGARTQRLISPRHVRRSRGELMLVAHCHLRNEQRTFKLDRIVGMTRPQPPAQPAPIAAVLPSHPPPPQAIEVTPHEVTPGEASAGEGAETEGAETEDSAAEDSAAEGAAIAGAPEAPAPHAPQARLDTFLPSLSNPVLPRVVGLP